MKINPGKITSWLVALITQLSLSINTGAQTIHVFSGAEFVAFDTIRLNSDPAAVWSTDRSNLPGYFSVINESAFTGAVDGRYRVLCRSHSGNKSTNTRYKRKAGHDDDRKRLPVVQNKKCHS